MQKSHSLGENEKLLPLNLNGLSEYEELLAQMSQGQNEYDGLDQNPNIRDRKVKVELTSS